MATSIPIAPSKVSRKGEPPKFHETRGNLTKPSQNDNVALNFKVPSEFKKDFKIAAATQGIKQVELLQQAFQEWKERHG